MKIKDRAARVNKSKLNYYTDANILGPESTNLAQHK